MSKRFADASFANLTLNEFVTESFLADRPALELADIPDVPEIPDVIDDNNNNNNNNNNTKEKYSQSTVLYIRISYIIILIVWFVLVIILPLGRYGIIGTFILLIPPIIILIGYSFIEDMTLEFEESIFKTNLMSIGLLIIVPLLSWASSNYEGSLRDFIVIILVSILISMFSMIEAWTNRQWTSVFKHARSGLQTISLTLLIYAIYLYLRSEYIPQCP